MKSKPITIKDLAKKLNLNPSTISRALHDNPDINKETINKVKNLAKKLNYQPNTLAMGLRSKVSFTIGVVIPKITSYLYSAAISGIEDLAYNSGYKVIICQSNEDSSREEIILQTLLSARVDGILIAISYKTKEFYHIQRALDQKIPLVFFNRITNAVDTHKVISQDYEGAIKAVKHLIENGYKKIAHLGGPKSLQSSINRKKGYNDALKNQNIKLNADYFIACGLNEVNGYEAMKKLLALDNPPDAVLAFNDRVAIGAMNAIKEAKLKIPQDIGLIGFSNNPNMTITSPPLSTVDQEGYAMGEAACKLLIEQIKNPSKRFETIKFDTRLVVRNSTIRKE